MKDELPGRPFFNGPSQETRNTLINFMGYVYSLIDRPCIWFREKVVLPNQKVYPYYHRKYNRVPTIDECYENDISCIYEAQEQFKRDKNLDASILNLLNRRRTECVRYEGHERHERCKKMFDDFEEASLNYFIKYGDLGAFPHVKYAYMKQKHRMIYERRKEAGTWNP
ncbi:NADH dehydrogenase [ubiquinone] 1 beta subcomplex subunit 10 [Parasteatoda tepidariorum]|uniref:NADH dehydrogenase [ubiquinone] 1 beta subcomplex subunit 10 n=1 Tax=Parasteatoda tepidariorum TaxID=114398 RepID=UPI00077FD362|nr:NADH dehydrogenase [ubiquinone] 1 beta subcomplex subunit 10 [Parasteatoda tepidariorum]